MQNDPRKGYYCIHCKTHVMCGEKGCQNPVDVAIPLHREQGEGSKSQLTGMRKDMEMALQREIMYDKALRDLCHLKKWKDEHGKDNHYEQFQPEAWAYAFSIIEMFGAHPDYAPPNSDGQQ